MALMRSSEIPKDAVVLNENEASSYIWEIVYDWKNLSDVWALRHGSTILGVINAVSGVVINRHYRAKLKLGTYGHLATLIPVSVMPAMLTMLFHRHLISTNLLLMKNEHCPICYEVRSAAIQLAMGITYPMLLAPTGALMLANRYNTYRVPHLQQGPKVMFKFVQKLTKPLTGTLTTLSLIQVAASSIITYFEFKNNIVFRNKLVDLERKILKERGQ
ncbi:uncharacterized protein LOC123720097 [Pieris brassicae]|uniref:Transmembrane protein 126A n=1 Tax=Pieris brassicae TaxID=7116 RepID=A0A9P0TTQ0_PIEBR|nr:uncharacterized protein LOC123720097 [Pieris brassicae]CAH4037644.1 unnamed protein product [Pieris brassicae]